MGAGQHREPRLPAGHQKAGTVCRETGRGLGTPAGTPAETLRPAHHRHHAPAETGRLPADREDERRQHQQHRPLGRRHRHRQEAAGERHLLLRRRRGHRPAGGRGKPGVLRLLAEVAGGPADRRGPVRHPDAQLRGAGRPGRPGHRQGVGRGPELRLADHRHHRGRPLRLPRLYPRLVRPLLRRGVQPGQALPDHRPAGLPTGADRQVQGLGQ
ncbi:MAG: hypothetical protein BWY73_01037 [candidate division TA06 bacterium ADurb.Bin417]|uniref:Uncharacterized protein n=1 Tax=candidate division TA06 bacterium ADurb.Bin417 TaxID=1852828 RepID=A0A1V5MFQ8_UNCT6|nr:MAG: hypothetical protein BWY73_01037 [candidate division TA06 bacterium ADurb.Bin417]